MTTRMKRKFTEVQMKRRTPRYGLRRNASTIGRVARSCRAVAGERPAFGLILQLVDVLSLRQPPPHNWREFCTVCGRGMLLVHHMFSVIGTTI